MMLADYISRQSTRPFDWSDNNCMGFVSGALVAQGYDPLPINWREGYATPSAALRRYRRLLRDLQHQHVTAAFDDRFERVFTLHPTDGLIAARRIESVMGWVFGVTFRGGVVYLTEQGIVTVDPSADDIFWQPA